MNISQNSKLSLVLVFGMACSSVLMLTANSAAADHQAAASALRNTPTMVTELPPVVITGKRLSAAEKAQYRQAMQEGSRQG
jgi:hypothetical protein